MLEDTRDDEQIIERVAASDIGKASWSAVSGCPLSPGRVGAGRR